MSDSEIHDLLKQRLETLEERICAACARSQRDRREITFIAVTKSVTPRVARLLPNLGIRDLGESRPQELWKKAEALKDLPVRWHMIGHMQRNKLERTLPLVHRFHSGDSERLLLALEQEAAQQNRRLPVMIEVNASREESKNGFSPDVIPSLSDLLNRLPHLQVDGLMTMAAYATDPAMARSTFQELRKMRDQIPGHSLKNLSMGMSNDFESAIEEGATFIRIGTTLFEGLAGE